MTNKEKELIKACIEYSIEQLESSNCDIEIIANNDETTIKELKELLKSL